MTTKTGKKKVIGTYYARQLVNKFENAVFDLAYVGALECAEDRELVKARYEAAKENLLIYIART